VRKEHTIWLDPKGRGNEEDSAGSLAGVGTRRKGCNAGKPDLIRQSDSGKVNKEP